MKIFFLVCISMIFVLSFSSCHKQQDADPTPNTDSTMLKSFALLIPNNSPFDTSNKFNYFYDGDKRIKQIDGYSGYDPVTTYGNYFTVHFFYTGNEPLPFKTVRLSGNLRYRDTLYVDTAHYFYANGKLSMDSVVHYLRTTSGNGVSVYYRHSYDAQRYTYNGNNVSALTDNWFFGFGQLKATVNIVVIQTSANSIMIERQRTAIGSPVTSTQRYRVLYDNKPNPLLGLEVPKPAYGLLYYTLVYRNSFPNNVVEFEKIYDSGNSGAWYDKYDYTYRSDSYPLAGTHYDVTLNWLPYYRKGLYKYY
jgi:hypothetical protein